MTKRSISATSEGIAKAKHILECKAWTQEDLATEAGLSSRNSVWKFLSGRPVDRKIFKELCFKLDLDWENVADLNRVSSSSHLRILPENSDVSELVSVMRSQVKGTIETQSNALQSSFELTQPPLENVYTKAHFFLEPSYQRWLEVSDLELSLANTEGLRFSRTNSNTVSEVELVDRRDKLVILGKPGAGKTTFLQNLALQCNNGKYRRDLIPCFVQLRSEWDQGNNESIDILTYLIDYGKKYGLSHKQVLQLLEAGKFLCLLDGLDEVPQQQREGLCKNIQTFTQKFAKNSIIITSRSSAQHFHFRGFTYVEMADFDYKNIQSFAQKWFVATSKNTTEGKKKAQQFLEQLNSPENQPIRELAVTPILLNLLCSVFKERATFPRQRVKLYETGLDILLQRWDQSRGIERDDFYHDLPLLHKRKLLSKIAALNFSEGCYFFESREIQEIIEEYLCNNFNFQEDRETLWLTSEVVLKSMEVQHGFLVQRAKDVYSFSHLTFQEYFVARNIIASERHSLADKITELAPKMMDDTWREVIRLTVSMLPKADILIAEMKQFLDHFSQQDLKLQDCLKLLDKKVDSLELSCQKSAARAFYFTLLNHRDFNLALSLEPEFAYQSQLSQEIQLDSILSRAFLDSLKLAENPNLKKFLNLCFSLELETKYKLDANFLDSFGQLKSQLPAPEKGKDYILDWWQTQGQEWVDRFRDLLLKHRQICFDWQLTEQEKDLWNRFYNGNVFLVECLQGEGKISSKLKEKIVANLLLPVQD